MYAVTTPCKRRKEVEKENETKKGWKEDFIRKFSALKIPSGEFCFCLPQLSEIMYPIIVERKCSLWENLKMFSSSSSLSLKRIREDKANFLEIIYIEKSGADIKEEMTLSHHTRGILMNP